MTERLDLNLLRVFDAVVRAGSVTAAAETLHLSIPATSRALARLRRAIGDPVLVRSGRGMAPTPFALRTAPRVRSLIEDAESLTSSGRRLDVATLDRTFTVRINDGGTAMASAAVRAVGAAAPGVVLRFVAEGEESTEALRDGSVDVDVGAGDVSTPDLRSEALYREQMVGIINADSTLGRRPTLAAVCRHPHVSASRRGRTRGPLDDVLEAQGLRRHVVAAVPSFAAAALLVASSDCVALVPSRLAAQYAETLGVRWFPLPADLPPIDVRMCWHARLDADPAQQWLRRVLRDAAGSARP